MGPVAKQQGRIINEQQVNQGLVAALGALGTVGTRLWSKPHPTWFPGKSEAPKPHRSKAITTTLVKAITTTRDQASKATGQPRDAPLGQPMHRAM